MGEMATQKRLIDGQVGDIRTWQHELVMAVLRALVVVTPLAAAVGSYYDYTRQIYLSIPLYWISYGLLLVVTFWRRVPYSARVVTVVLLLYLLAISDFASEGRGSSGRVFLMMLPFAASIFFSTRRALVAMGIVAVTMVGVGLAFWTGALTVTQEVDSTDLLGWISNTLVMLLIAAFMVTSHHYLVPRMARALGEGRRLQEALEQERADLEAEVKRRTADLTRRNVALQAAAQVARDAAQVHLGGLRSVEQVLTETVSLISDAFGYYHCAIFVVEEEWAVLKAVSSTQGQAMLAEGHRLPVKAGTEGGVVGNAAASGEAHVALDVGRDAVYFDNPHLPQTRSEVAVPLRVGWPEGTRVRPEGGREAVPSTPRPGYSGEARPYTRSGGTRAGGVIGVLDVQSRTAAAFDEGDVAVLQTLADQIALAIVNTRLVQDLQASVESERRAYGELSRDAWRVLLTQGKIEERYDPMGVLAEKGAWREGMRRAAVEGRPISEVVDELPALAMPVRVRGQVIGVLDARKPAGMGSWTEQEQELIEALVDQLAVALDSAQLYEESQRRATRERIVGDVASRMHETLDMETILWMAADEMRQALHLAEVEVCLAKVPTGE